MTQLIRRLKNPVECIHDFLRRTATVLGVALLAVHFAESSSFADDAAGTALKLKPSHFEELSDNDILLKYHLKAGIYSDREPIYNDIDALCTLWRASADARARAQAVRLIEIAAGEWSGRSADSLARDITPNGSRDRVNIGLRDACLLFAQRAALTRDPQSAESAIAILNRFAEVLPSWPIWSPISVPEDQRSPLAADAPKTYEDEAAAGAWGKWIYFDLLESLPLLKARNLIRESGFQGLNGPALQKMFEHLVQVQRWHGVGPDYSNMDAFQIRGKLWFGMLLPNADLFREGAKQLHDLYRVGFYPDGWWWESSLSYHKDLQTVLRQIVQEFSQSPELFDALNAIESSQPSGSGVALRKLLSQLRRADSVIRDSRLPNGNFLAVHDSVWDDRTDPVLAPASYPTLFGAMGQGSIASGIGDDRTVATLHWGRSSTHAHHDSLNLHLWSKGREVFSETNYRPIEGSGSTREWQASTPAHTTVTVDEVDQNPIGPRGRQVREAQPADVLTGIDWRWRWNSWQAANDFGSLRLFSTDFAPVQVMEADAEAAYSAVAPVTRYRRTIALVELDEHDNYILDIFRVRGGSTHDFVLHGCLQESYEIVVTPPLTPQAGTLFGFMQHLRGGTAERTWLSAIRMTDNLACYSIFPGLQRTEVILADAPAMRRTGTAPFLIVRRRAGESTFVVVHHVTHGRQSRIKQVELVDTSSPSTVACRVTLDDRVDTIVSCEDNKASVRISDGIEVTGAFAHLAASLAGDLQWAYLIDGNSLRTGDLSILGSVSHDGVIVKSDSFESGQARDAFVCQDKIGSGDGLAGQVLLVEPPSLPRWAYRIQGCDWNGVQSAIRIDNEPGLSIAGDSVKQEYFPNWGGRGPVRFHIPGSALWLRNADGSATFRQTGSAMLKEKPTS